jgi:acetoin utilization deacetylase AcuC-like enzyme
VYNAHQRFCKMATSEPSKLIVVAPLVPERIRLDETGAIMLSAKEKEADDQDRFNHPRERRALILKAINAKAGSQVRFVAVDEPEGIDLAELYSVIHSEGLLGFLTTAWNTWEEYGEEGRDPGAFLGSGFTSHVPPLIPINVPLPRDIHQHSSQSIIGKIGYYCTDLVTPVFGTMLKELEIDYAIIKQAVESAIDEDTVVYAMPTHPGHHAAQDSFGGYCYLNQAAYAVKRFQERIGPKVAVLDVDYHAGNGTASIFYDDPNVLVVSIHCDPDYDYPFHSGFADQKGVGEGEGATFHLPLPPLTRWDTYEKALLLALDRIKEFGAVATIVSLGLDTHEGDPCAIRRAGFCLSGEDYTHMGAAIAAGLPDGPVVFVQEGGYRMDEIGNAASSVVLGYALNK